MAISLKLWLSTSMAWVVSTCRTARCSNRVTRVVAILAIGLLLENDLSPTIVTTVVATEALGAAVVIVVVAVETAVAVVAIVVDAVATVVAVVATVVVIETRVQVIGVNDPIPMVATKAHDQTAMTKFDVNVARGALLVAMMEAADVRVRRADASSKL